MRATEVANLRYAYSSCGTKLTNNCTAAIQSAAGGHSLRESTLSTLDADYWRKRAKEAGAQAEQMSSAVDKRELLDIAKAYERLAELASKRKILRE